MVFPTQIGGSGQFNKKPGSDWPDRAARIRALADRWVGTMLHGPNGDEWMDAERSWSYARTCVNELDRLEADEREKERESE